MDFYGVFNSDGSPVAFYNNDIHGPRQRPVYGERPEPTEDEPDPVAPIIGYEPNPGTLVPAEAVQITEAQWREFIDNPGHRRWVEGQVVVYDPPAPPAPPIVLPAEALFFDRMTDEEYDDLDASVRAGETARVYRGWAAAAVFEERTAMWELLVKHLDAIGTTPARRAELLAPPSASAARAKDAVA